MGVLDTVLAYKAQKDAAKNADLLAVGPALAAFQTAKQATHKSIIDDLTVKIAGAKQGLAVDTNTGMITPDATLNPLGGGGNVLLVGNDGEVEVAGQFGRRDKVFKKSLTADEMGDRAAATEGEKQKFFKEPEIADLRDIGDTRDTLGEVRSGLEDLGIKDPSKYGTIEMETLDSNFGPISMPARFNLVGQYAKDPKYTAVKEKLERSFNKYRKIITGAQASNQELGTLRKSFASFKDRPEVFFENLSSLENETDRMLKNRLDLYDTMGRDTSKLRELYERKGISQDNSEDNSVSLPDGITEDDITTTLKAHPELTRESLLKKLGGK